MRIFFMISIEKTWTTHGKTDKSEKKRGKHSMPCKGLYGESAQGSGWTKQVESQERVRAPWTNVLWGARIACTINVIRGIYWLIWTSLVSYKGGQEEKLVSWASLIILVHLVAWVRCSVCLCGCWNIRKMQSYKS